MQPRCRQAVRHTPKFENMGLMIHSLEGMPEGHHRDYYIYLLDYGWDEPLGEALKNNFNRMATLASEQKNAVVIMPTEVGAHFSDQVLSWHSINGDDADKESLLPAILLTNRHPSEFRQRSLNQNTSVENDLKLVLFPLKKYCQSTTQVVELIQKIFRKIKNGEALENFEITKQKKKGLKGALASSIVLEPKIMGMGISLNKLMSYFKEK